MKIKLFDDSKLNFYFRMLSIQRKTSDLTEKMSFFATSEWKFKNKNFLDLCHALKSEDLKHFDFRAFFIHDKILYVRKVVYGARKNLFALKDDDLVRDRRKMKVLLWTRSFLKFLMVLLIVFLFYMWW